MTEPGSHRHVPSDEELRGAAEPPEWTEIAVRAERVKELVTERFRQVQATARAKERERMETELAEALGVEPEVVSWSTMLPMVIASAAIADRVMTEALGPDESVDADRRKELLTMFGVAEDYARVELAADRVGEDLGRRTIAGLEVKTMDAAPAVGRCGDPSPHGAHTVGETYCPGRS